MERKLVFFIDFDGTISREDVCYKMVKTFAAHGWEELNSLWEKGVLSTVDCARRTLQLMSVDNRELQAFFDEMGIDESFAGFVKWIKSKAFPLYILSDGYDNYIEILLKKKRLQLPVYANHLEYQQEGWQIQTPHLNEECQKCGVCKSGIIKRLISQENISVYVGDGYSDLCPAGICDIVFAKDRLAEYCEETGIKYFAFDDFNDIQRKIEELISGCNEYLK
jgi:2,3-diketo-5-methylthio-1-phosphopentane phosphatase